IHAACKQSGQLWFPALAPIQDFNDVLNRSDAVRIIAYEAASLQAKPDVFFRGHFHGKHILFLIGGEGGFSEAEVSAARRAGFEEMSFGKKILRAETAGIFAAALVKAGELQTSPSF
ncbi:MAG: RsmE family RNA methyltransferase, partial [Rhizobacter sp.]|nr:RsmE family RNA methyltransferase [Chlorobiales bacterium]